MPVRTYQPSFTGGELAPSMHARTDLAKYGVGLKTCRNFMIHPHGGVSTRPGFEFVAEVKDSTKRVRLIPFRFNVSQQYVLEFGDLYMRVHKDGGVVTESTKAITGATQANPVVITSAGHDYANGDEIVLAGIVGMTELNGRTCKVVSATTDTFALTDKTGAGIDGTAFSAYVSGGTVARVYEITTPYAEADLSRLQCAGRADTMFLVHPSHQPRKLARHAHADWRLSLIAFAPTATSPAGLRAVHTGNLPAAAKTETKYYAVTAISPETGEESLPSAPVSITAAMEGSWQEGAYVTVSWPDVGGTTLARASFTVVSGNGASVAATGAVMTGTGGNGTITSIKVANSVELLSAAVPMQAGTWETLNKARDNINALTYAHGYSATTSTDTGTAQVGTDEFGNPIMGTVTTGYRISITSPVSDPGANGKSITVTGTMTGVTTAAFAGGAFHGVTSVNVNGADISGPVLYGASADATARAIADAINRRYSSPEYDAVVSGATVSVRAQAGTGTGPNGYPFTVSTVGTITLSNVSTALDGGVEGNESDSGWQYRVYKKDNGIFGFIGVTDVLTFRDDNISPDVAQTPPAARNPFSGAGKYPSTVGFYEQRIYYFNTLDSPLSGWGSVINSYSNFNVSRPARADEAISFTVPASQVNEIRHMIPLGDMILLTSDAEIKVSGTGDGNGMAPGQISIKPQSYRGSSWVRPIVIGNTIIYIQDKGSIVRDLGYKLEVDGFTGDDLSVLSNHLFDGYQITDWAYAQVPHSIVWCVRSDGVLLGLTYMREHEVWGWHRHDTDGAFESVCTISEGQEDVLYAVVRRTIGGVTRRYVERLHERNWQVAADAFCVDSGLSYSGAPVAEVGNLHHLAGKKVSILAGGDVLAQQTVTGDGRVFLPRAYGKVHVGLPYQCDIETLDIDMGMTGQGTVQARKKSVPRVIVRLWRSREFQAGPSVAKLLKTKMRQEHWDEAIALYTGDQELVLQPTWNSHGRVLIRQDDPVPLTILAIMPEVEIGG